MTPSPAPTSAPAPLPYTATGAKLGTAALGFVVAVVAAITLQPFRPVWPTDVQVMLWHNWFDALANVALFVPLGFLYALRRSARPSDDAAPAERRRTLLRTLALGTAASAAVEVAQCFLPGRVPSPVDVATNAAGALLGAWLHARAARRLGADTRLVGLLALELPVVGLAYVTLPLCTLAAITAAATDAPRLAGVPVRAGALLLLAAFGGTLLGTVQRRRLGPTRALGARTTALVAGGWFAVGALPAVSTAPAAFALGTALAALTAWELGRQTPQALGIERRFEAEALLRAAPFLVGYLLLIPLGDPAAGVDTWTRLGILRHLETVAAFTVAGYLLAEAWGRRQLRYRHTAWRVALVAGVAALAVAGVRAWSAHTRPSAGAVVTLAVAAAYGGWIYHLQRAHVQALVDARRAAAAPAPAHGRRRARAAA